MARKVTLTFDFKYDAGGMGKGGTIPNGRADKTTGLKYSLYEGQDIGQDSGSPVDFTCTPPSPFKGQFHKVTVELK